MENNINKQLNQTILDMASAVNATKEFSGKENENIEAWIKEVKMIGKVTQLDPISIFKLILIKLRGVAQSWASELYEKEPHIELNEFVKRLCQKFCEKKNDTMEVLERITKKGEVKSIDELKKLIKDTTIIIERGGMNVEMVIKIVINKMPGALKPMAYQIGYENYDWVDFVRRLEECAWMGFMNSIPESREEDKNICEVKQVGAFKQKRVKCLIHGWCRHTTEECWSIKKLAARSKNKNKNVNALCETTHTHEQEKDIFNKDQSVYFVNVNYKPSPFIKQVIIDNTTLDILIDTGADITLIKQSDIPKNMTIITPNKLPKVRSASGNLIPIIGYIHFSKAKLEDETISFKAYVTSTELKYIILGRDTLAKNPIILATIANKLTNDKAVMSINSPEEILRKYDILFKDEIDANKICTFGTHDINLTCDKPFFECNSRIPINFEEAIDNEIKKYIRLGVIEASNSLFCSRLVPINKPDGSLRLCVDFRTLNKNTVKDRYTIPRIDEIVDALSSASIFTTLDATSGYHQIAISPEDTHKTAFRWKNKLYEFKRMPFGLCNAPSTFQRIMDKILSKELGKFVIPYLDDVIIYSKNEKEHTEHVSVILNKLLAAGIVLNKKKCKFFKEEIKILGYIISKGKVRPDPAKISAIQNYQRPRNIKELRSFLGICNYMRQFIQNYAKIAQPLCNLLKGESKRSVKVLKWNNEINQVFLNLKKK